MTAFPGLGTRLAIALECAGIDTIPKLAAIVRDDNLLTLPGISTFDQVATIRAWLTTHAPTAVTSGPFARYR